MSRSSKTRNTTNAQPDSRAAVSGHMRSRSRIYVLISWVAVVLWAAVIFYMSAHTSGQFSGEMGLISRIYEALKAWQLSVFGEGSQFIYNAAHFLEYTVFGALLTNALSCHMSLARAALCAAGLALAYGITDEIHQLFVPSRSSDPMDCVFDFLGGSTGAALVYAIAPHVAGRIGREPEA